MEIWKDVVGYEGIYQVSNMGNVKSLDRVTSDGRRIKGVILNGNICYGYVYVNLQGKSCRVHRLVAQAFIPNKNDKPCVDHINTIRDDNRVENLRWVTHKENCNNPISKKKNKDHCGKRTVCDKRIYSSAKECAEYYNVPKTTLVRWLSGYTPMPQKFIDLGLSYMKGVA